MDLKNQVFIRFRELANKDISDEEIFEDLCHLEVVNRMATIKNIEVVKLLRNRNPSLEEASKHIFPCPEHLYEFVQLYVRGLYDPMYITKENYEMKKRIRSLEQTLKTFMEQTKAERLSQEAVIQSLSKEMDEFQEEFYDCQSDTQERVDLIQDALRETIQTVEKLEAELRTLKERTPVKDKIA
jgi:hypothetical protein